MPVTALEACGDGIGPDLERRRLGFHRRTDQSGYVRAYADWLSRTLAAAPQPRFIASSEHLHAWLTTPERVAALDRFLGMHFAQVSYLIYLRPQEDLLTSGYSEAVRRGARHDFATHLARRSRMNLWHGLKPWLAVVGRDRLQVRLMVRDALQGGDLLTDFCAAAGICADGLARPPRVNSALSPGEIALRRRLNCLLPVQARSGGMHPLYAAALRALAPVARNDRRLQLSPAQVADVRARNAASNEKIRKHFFHNRPALF